MIARRGFPWLAALGVVPVAAATEPRAHRVCVHVDEQRADVMALALGNIANLRDICASRGEVLAVELVANGHGVTMLTEGSPVAAQIAQVKSTMDLTLSACANSMRMIEKSTGNAPEPLGAARVVPAGIYRLVELQEAGFSYVKP